MGPGRTIHSCSQLCEAAREGTPGSSRASALTGHVFSMLHDNSKPCVDLNEPGSTSRHVMTPVMAHVDPEEPWSPCSARFITDFLDNGYGRQTSHLFPGAMQPCSHCALLPPSAWAEWNPLQHGMGQKLLPGEAYFQQN